MLISNIIPKDMDTQLRVWCCFKGIISTCL